MSGLKSDITSRNLAPAKVHLVDAGRVVPTKWSRRRTLFFILASCIFLWGVIGIGLWLIL
jgi:hypothetical protein